MQRVRDAGQTRRGRALLAVAIGLVLVAAVGAAVYDWVAWEPYNAVLPYLAIIVLALLAVAFAIPRRGRIVALLAGATALGLVLGGVLGPSRPELRHGEGSMRATLTSPTGETGAGAATCAVDDRATELQVSGDLRVNVFPDDPAAPPDVDQREFLGIGVWVGDRWRRVVREDGVAMFVLVGRVEGELSETRLVAGPDSTVTLDWTAEGGRVTFDGLVPDTGADPPGEPVDIAGTVEWTCDAARG